MKPHILVLSEYWTPDPGGMATYAAEIVPRLGKLGFSITLLVPHRKELKRDNLDSDNVKGKLFWSPPVHFLGRFTILPALLRYGQLRKIDAIVDIAVSPYGGVSSLCSRLLNVPHIIGAHGNEVSRLFPEVGMSPTFRAFCLYAYRHATTIVPNSQFTATLFEPLGIDSSKLSVITLGADTGFYSPGTPSDSELAAIGGAKPAPRLLCAGQLKEMKGQKYLIRALPRIAEKFPDVSLDLAGSGPLEESYRQLVSGLGIEQRVRFHGNLSRTELRTLYRLADVLVMPTQRDTVHVEGFGLVAAEALACGCPVAASDWGGQTEFVKNGETGILFDAASESSIAESVVKLLNDTLLRNKIRLDAPQFIAKEYTWDKAADQWATLLERLITNRK